MGKSHWVFEVESEVGKDGAGAVAAAPPQGQDVTPPSIPADAPTDIVSGGVEAAAGAPLPQGTPAAAPPLELPPVAVASIPPGGEPLPAIAPVEPVPPAAPPAAAAVPQQAILPYVPVPAPMQPGGNPVAQDVAVPVAGPTIEEVQRNMAAARNLPVPGSPAAIAEQLAVAEGAKPGKFEKFAEELDAPVGQIAPPGGVAAAAPPPPPGVAGVPALPAGAPGGGPAPAAMPAMVPPVRAVPPAAMPIAMLGAPVAAQQMEQADGGSAASPMPRTEEEPARSFYLPQVRERGTPVLDVEALESQRVVRQRDVLRVETSVRRETGIPIMAFRGTETQEAQVDANQSLGADILKLRIAAFEHMAAMMRGRV